MLSNVTNFRIVRSLEIPTHAALLHPRSAHATVPVALAGTCWLPSMGPSPKKTAKTRTRFFLSESGCRTLATPLEMRCFGGVLMLLALPSSDVCPRSDDSEPAAAAADSEAPAAAGGEDAAAPDGRYGDFDITFEPFLPRFSAPCHFNPPNNRCNIHNKCD